GAAGPPAPGRVRSLRMAAHTSPIWPIPSTVTVGFSTGRAGTRDRADRGLGMPRSSHARPASAGQTPKPSRPRHEPRPAPGRREPGAGFPVGATIAALVWGTDQAPPLS